MIVANLATYPPRTKSMLRVVSKLAHQVDRLNVVLNQYDDYCEELDAFQNVNQVIPEEDLKDVGKFVPEVKSDDLVFLVDDDIVYADDYVASTIARLKSLPCDRLVVGYHASRYWKRQFSIRPKKLMKWLRRNSECYSETRSVDVFYLETNCSTIVDQIGTGTALLPGELMPSSEFMRDSQSFVDVRFARWCFEQDIKIVSLSKAENWLQPIHHERTIYEDFTRSKPAHVTAEIEQFALKRANIGKIVREE